MITARCRQAFRKRTEKKHIRKCSNGRWSRSAFMGQICSLKIVFKTPNITNTKQMTGDIQQLKYHNLGRNDCVGTSRMWQTWTVLEARCWIGSCPKFSWFCFSHQIQCLLSSSCCLFHGETSVPHLQAYLGWSNGCSSFLRFWEYVEFRSSLVLSCRAAP